MCSTCFEANKILKCSNCGERKPRTNFLENDRGKYHTGSRMSQRCADCRTKQPLVPCAKCGRPTFVDRDMLIDDQVACASCHLQYVSRKTCVVCNLRKERKQFGKWMWEEVAVSAKVCRDCQGRGKQLRARLATSKRKCTCQMDTHTDRCALRDPHRQLRHPGWDVLTDEEHAWLQRYPKRTRKED